MYDSIEEAGYRIPSEHGEFMEPEITAVILWYVFDGQYGVTNIPFDLIGQLTNAEHGADGTMPEIDFPELDVYDRAMIAAFYFGEIATVEIVLASGARMSASGYMDCTDWLLADTEDRAMEVLLEDYPDAFLVEVYRVTFTAHCGMQTLDMLYHPGERADARKRIAAILRDRRNSGHNVTALQCADSAVQRWESTEPEVDQEYCAMIPDTAGILSMRTLDVFPNC